jgi:3-hydroxyacyl-[acyl-carrier protein] dehydratase / trans-2-decenoyl-[acyl-carrier protein] isomerase
MKYAEYLERTAFSKAELLAFASGVLVDDPPPELSRLPLPPLLMFDRVVALERAGNRGRVVAEQDVALDAWYFQCHFRGDPVQPGCLGVDAVWQLLGFFMAASGCPGTGRALGCKEVEFFGQIRPHDRVVTYTLDVRRLTRMKDAGAALALADATVAVDGEVIYTVQQAKVGTFLGIKYSDYPLPGQNSRGGVMRGRERS